MYLDARLRLAKVRKEQSMSEVVESSNQQRVQSRVIWSDGVLGSLHLAHRVRSMQWDDDSYY